MKSSTSVFYFRTSYFRATVGAIESHFILSPNRSRRKRGRLGCGRGTKIDLQTIFESALLRVLATKTRAVKRRQLIFPAKQRPSSPAHQDGNNSLHNIVKSQVLKIKRDVKKSLTRGAIEIQLRLFTLTCASGRLLSNNFLTMLKQYNPKPTV